MCEDLHMLMITFVQLISHVRNVFVLKWILFTKEVFTEWKEK